MDAPVEIIEADLSRDFPRDLPSSLDGIIHLAQAARPFPEGADELFGVNVGSTHRLLELARRTGASRFVYASTGSVYRPASQPIAESAETHAGTFYTATKLMSEIMLSQYSEYCSAAVLRLFAPYGPTQENRLIPRLVQSVREGTPIYLSHGGQPRMNPIFITDVVAIFTEALTHQSTYTVNIAGPQAMSIRDLAEIIGSELDIAPAFVARDSGPAGDLVADTTRMEAIFGARAHTSPSDGIHRMLHG